MHDFPIEQPMRRRLFIPIAAGMGVAYLAQFIVVMHAYDGMRALRQASMDWMPWVGVAPLVVWFAERVPVSARSWRWTIPVHAVACLAALALHLFIGYGIGVALPGGHAAGSPQYGEHERRASVDPSEARGVLQSGNRDDVTLAEEFRLVRAYLGIQRIRFGEKLRFSIDLPAELENAAVPMLLLQPIVENAIVHGIARRADGGDVALAARRADGRLVLEVVSVMPDAIQESAAVRHGTGIGLKNCRERLAARHGAEAGLAAGPDGDGRWRTTVTLPLAGISSVS